MKHFRKAFLLMLGFTLAAGFSNWQIATAQNRPLTYPEISTALNSKLPNKVFKNKSQLINWLITQIEKRKVDKALTEDREDDLRQAGATANLLETIRQNSPSLRAQTSVSTPTPSRTPTNSNDSKTFKNSIGMEFVRIPSGSFMMGSDNGEADEKPIHRVSISDSFLMGKTEVTQGQWKAIMGDNPSVFSICGDSCPVENVSWEDVQDFIRELNNKGEGTYRLPTEAEWEYAARADSTTKYSYGDGDGEGSLGNYAWYEANSGSKTHQVATKQPNDWGLYDMHGNVWEWCADWYGNYSIRSVVDPASASVGSYRVSRGGSWYSNAENLRSTSRYNISPSLGSGSIGFRLLRTD